MQRHSSCKLWGPACCLIIALAKPPLKDLFASRKSTTTFVIRTQHTSTRTIAHAYAYAYSTTIISAKFWFKFTWVLSDSQTAHIPSIHPTNCIHAVHNFPLSFLLPRPPLLRLKLSFLLCPSYSVFLTPSVSMSFLLCPSYSLVHLCYVLNCVQTCNLYLTSRASFCCFLSASSFLALLSPALAVCAPDKAIPLLLVSSS